MAGCDPLTEGQIQRMEAACTGAFRLRDRCFMVLADSTGYRVSELLSLTVGDVWSPGRIKDRMRVATGDMKGGVARGPVPVHPDAKRALIAWLAALHQMVGNLPAHCPLFRSRKSQTQARAISRQHAWRLVKNAALAIGLTARVGCHSFRKALAIRVYRAFKNDILLVQSVLGHRQVSSTQHYLTQALSAASVTRAFSLPRGRHQ